MTAMKLGGQKKCLINSHQFDPRMMYVISTCYILISTSRSSNTWD